MFDAFPRSPLIPDTITEITSTNPALSRLYWALQAGTVDPLRGDGDIKTYGQRAPELNISKAASLAETLSSFRSPIVHLP